MSTLDNQPFFKKKKRKKKSFETASPTKKTLFLISRSMSFIYSKVFDFSKKKPHLITTFFLIASATSAASYCKRFLLAYSEKQLPNIINLDVSNSALRVQIRNIAEKELREARNHKLSRSEYMKKTISILDNMDAIDEFWVRSGLDGRIQIRATAQIPILILEVSNNDRYLIGHKHKIMAKNFPDLDYPSVLRITAPEMRLSNNYLKHSGTNNEMTHRPNRFSAFPKMNYTWLANQGQKIQTAFINRKIGYTIEKIGWKSSLGFSLFLKPLENSLNSPENQIKLKPLNVVMGEQELQKKMEKLSKILDDLSSKQLIPENIDLNFREKALIKFADSSNKISL